MGPKSGPLIDGILALYTLPICIGYGVFVFDCLHRVLLELLPAGGWYTSRAFVGFVVTIFVILPICSFSKIDSLTYTSLLGLGAILYCYIFVAVDLAQNAEQMESIISHAFWGPRSLLGLFPITNIYSACFLVQYNAPQFFFELRNPTNRRFTFLSFAAVIFVMMFTASFAIMGFARWGMKTPGNILTQYDSAYAVWIATSVSLLTTYPFDFDAGRRSVISALTHRFPDMNRTKIFWTTTLVLIPVFSTVSVLVDNLSLIVGLNGSLFGITVGLTVPGLLIFQRAKCMQFAPKKFEKCLGLAVALLGVFLSVLGFVSLFVS